MFMTIDSIGFLKGIFNNKNNYMYFKGGFIMGPVLIVGLIVLVFLIKLC